MEYVLYRTFIVCRLEGLPDRLELTLMLTYKWNDRCLHTLDIQWFVIIYQHVFLVTSVGQHPTRRHTLASDKATTCVYFTNNWYIYSNVCYLSESWFFSRWWLAFKCFPHSSSGLSASPSEVMWFRRLRLKKNARSIWKLATSEKPRLWKVTSIAIHHDRVQQQFSSCDTFIFLNTSNTSELRIVKSKALKYGF